jgi:phosphate transport system permease protein
MPRNFAGRVSAPFSPKKLINTSERAFLGFLALVLVILPVAMGAGLFLSSRELFASKPLADLFSAGRWSPSQGEYTFLPFLAGTVWVTLLALVLALPLSLAVAVYLSEYASPRLAAVLKPVIDVLAGLPSVIFGLWGVIVIVPFVRDIVSPLVGVATTGYTILSASLVLALMITPILIQVCVEVFTSVPMTLRQAVFALGATRWEVVKKAVVRKALPGIVAAVVLALARAFGETLAVMMVVGGLPRVPSGPLAPAATLPTLIANGYSEMSSVPLYHRALMGAAFILFAVVVVFTLISHLVLARIKRRME